LLALGLQGGQPVPDTGVLVIEGALLEGDQVAVDGGAGVLQLAGDRSEFVAQAGAVGGVLGLELGDGLGDEVALVGVEVRASILRVKVMEAV